MRSLPVPPHGLGSLGIRVGPGILCSPLSSLSRCWMSWFYRWFSKMERLMFQSSQVRFKKNFLCLRLKKKVLLLKDSWFTVLCEFQVYHKVSRLYRNVYLQWIVVTPSLSFGCTRVSVCLYDPSLCPHLFSPLGSMALVTLYLPACIF